MDIQDGQVYLMQQTLSEKEDGPACVASSGLCLHMHAAGTASEAGCNMPGPLFSD